MIWLPVDKVTVKPAGIHTWSVVPGSTPVFQLDGVVHEPVAAPVQVMVHDCALASECRRSAIRRALINLRTGDFISRKSYTLETFMRIRRQI